MQVISEPKELAHVLHASRESPFIDIFYISGSARTPSAPTIQPSYRYLGDPYDALLQVNAQLGVTQSLQQSV